MNVYFPGNQIWYDIVSFQKYEVSGEISVQVIYVQAYSETTTLLEKI